MLRVFLFLTLLAPAPAMAQGAVSEMIAERGLVATEAYLAGLPAPDATQRFALGGVRFLAAIEATLQTRWRLGLNRDQTDLPILRLPIPPNPLPDPFRGQHIEDMFARLASDMDGARRALATVEDADQVDLPIAILDLWFDIDGNGARGEGEGLTEVAGLALTGRPVTVITEAGEGPVVRFDTADAAWLSAYTHLLGAVSELVLAFAPAEEIDAVIASVAQMRGLAIATEYSSAFDLEFGRTVDQIAMIYFALRHQPDATHTRAARKHMLNMIGQNRRFWRLVALETDNSGEWLPNDNQVSGLGFELPKGAGAVWLDVLADLEAMLTGKRLIGHWRLREGAGINVARLMDDPIPVDIAGWAQGIDLLPYAEAGKRIDANSWRAFERMLSGDAMMMALYLN